MELSFIESRISTITLTLDILTSTQSAIVKIGEYKGYLSPNDFNEVNEIDKKVQRLSEKLEHLMIIKDGFLVKDCLHDVNICLN